MGWQPSLGAVVGLEIGAAEASSRTTDIVTNPATFPGPIRPPSEGDVQNTQPTVGLDFGITSPSIAILPNLLSGDSASDSNSNKLDLRFFTHAAVEANLAADTTATREGARNALRPPVGSTGAPVATFSEIGIVGQGTKGIVDIDTFQLRAGAGMVFGFELADRPVRVRTSVEYVRKRAQPRIGLSRAVQTRVGPPPTGNVNDFENDFRFVTLDTEQTITLHGIGPGIEMEADAARSGPFVWSVFGGFNAYHFVGDRSAEATVRNGIDPGDPSAVPPVPPVDYTSEQAEYKFEFKDWVYRINAGIRIRWQPE